MVACSEQPLAELLQLASESDFYSPRLKVGEKWYGDGGLPPSLPLTTRDALVAARREGGDAYSGRHVPGREALVTFQLDYPDETPLYLTLDAEDLAGYADALQRCLRLVGVQPGDTIAIFDFGTSPAVYLASSCYAPYLQRGAADALGCSVVCNDGVANVSHRGVTILEQVRPSCVVIRADCVQPFLAACGEVGIEPSNYTRAFVVTHNESSLKPAVREAWQRRLALPVYDMPRSDLALFLAVECPECRLVHTWSDLYLVETVTSDSLRPARPGEPGRLVVTSRFARSCPAIRILTQLEGCLATGSCPKGPTDVRLCL